jgi:hypothetical protein
MSLCGRCGRKKDEMGERKKRRGGRWGGNRDFGDGVEDDFCFAEQPEMEGKARQDKSNE